MENLISIEMIEQNQDALVGRIFTGLQLAILKKKLLNKPLDSNEKTYYYKYIKPKVKAMLLFSGIDEVNINGKEYIIPERIQKAIEILKRLGRKHKNNKIMISGSFLFNKDYGDIDIFVFSKYGKEDYRKGKVHVNFLPESALDSLFFSSLSQISISNFKPTPKNDFEIKLADVLQDYEVLIEFALKNKDFMQELRAFLLEAEYVSKGVILNTKQLYGLREKVNNKNAVKLLSDTMVNSILYGYDWDDTKKTLISHLKECSSLRKQYPHAKNLEIYINTYREVVQAAA